MPRPFAETLRLRSVSGYTSLALPTLTASPHQVFQMFARSLNTCPTGFRGVIFSKSLGDMYFNDEMSADLGKTADAATMDLWFGSITVWGLGVCNECWVRVETSETDLPDPVESWSLNRKHSNVITT